MAVSLVSIVVLMMMMMCYRPYLLSKRSIYYNSRERYTVYYEIFSCLVLALEENG